MAVSAVPAYLQNGSHSATLFRQASSSVVPNAGGLVQAGDLAVTQTGTASMAVVVGVGRAWVPGTNVANFSGFTFSSQAQYFVLNDGPVTLTVAAADPTNPRIDIVCLTVNDSQYSGSTNNAALQVVTGTPAASPTAPATPANSLLLANVSVAANATSISNSNITQVATAAIYPSTVPIAYANSAAVGSSTNLLTNLTNHSVQEIHQSGTYVGTPDANGNLTITYPKPFPNGVISSVAYSGDGSYNISATPSSVAAPTTASLFVNVKTLAGANVTSGSIRVNWMADGF